jgi:2-(1,2-epoxy-1,2-dihydrophenyl)acetyl-CoA isomerase
MPDHVLSERIAVAGEPGGRFIGKVTLNRPEVRNALTRSMLQDARRAVQAMAADPAVRVVVLTGAGEGQKAAFCAGADLRASVMEDPALMDKLDQYLDDFHGLVKSIWKAQKPVLARMDGGAVGFGCDLALCCDLRVLSRRAYFQESFSKIGLMPDGGGSATLVRMVGLGVAKEMIFLATKIEAERAERLGLATRVVDEGELDEATLQMATQLANGPPVAFAESKKAMHASLGVSIDDILAREREGQLRCLRTSDAMEGVVAWAQKRSPQFQGK